MAAGKFRAGIPNRFRQVDLEPEPASQIACQLCLCPASLQGSHLFPENVLGDGVHPLGSVQRSEPDSWLCGHPALRLGRVPVGQVEGNEETCVRVDTQKRPRSSITKSAPDNSRFPKMVWRRRAKSGQRSGPDGSCAGTMRAITFWRSRSSTIWPALNSSFRRRVSRNWRIFTDGIFTL